MNVDQKTVVITGAARGIGKDIAETFVNNSVRIVLVDIDADAVRQAATEIDDQVVEAHAGDVVSLEDMETVAGAVDVDPSFGRIRRSIGRML